MHNILPIIHTCIGTYDIQGISVINVTENGICVGLQIINDNSTGVTSTSHIYIESKGNSIFYTENDEFCRGASLLNHYQNYDLSKQIMLILLVAIIWQRRFCHTDSIKKSRSVNLFNYNLYVCNSRFNFNPL